MSQSPARPLVIVIHQNTQAQVTLRTTLEAGGHLTVMATADGVEAVERVIKSQPPVAALIFDWEYFDLNAPKFLPRLFRARVPQKPYLLAMHHDWQIQDLHRAEQLKVQGLLWAPLTLPNLVKEMVSLKKSGQSRSYQLTRQAISERRSLGRGGRQGKDRSWSNRMAALAANARTRSSGGNREEQLNLLLTAMDTALGRPVSIKLAEAVVLNLKGDGKAFTEFLNAYAVDQRAVQRLSEVVQKVGGSSQKAQSEGRTGASAISLHLATEVMALVKARAEGQRMSISFKDVRQAAAGFITDSSDAADLSMFMGEWLGIDAAVFARMDRERARRMSERMLAESNEKKAKGYARLFALASLLSARNAPKQMASDAKESLVGLASVLSSAKADGEDGMQQLFEMSEEARSGEDLGLSALELPDFNEFSSLFAEMSSELGEASEDIAALQRDLHALGMAMSEGDDAAAPTKVDASDARLFQLLSTELRLPQNHINPLKITALSANLPPCPMPDWSVPQDQLLIARVLACLLADERHEDRHEELMTAYQYRYEDEYLMIRALLVAVEQTQNPEALSALRHHLMLSTSEPTSRDIKNYIAQGALKQAMLAVADLPASGNQTAALINLVALSLRNAGLLNEAGWLYRMGLRQDATRINLLHNYARLKMDQGDLQVASQLLKRALQVDPQHEPSVELLESIRLQENARRRDEARQESG